MKFLVDHHLMGFFVGTVFLWTTFYSIMDDLFC